MVDVLSRPIPGQSLTMPKGGTPMEYPPRFVKVEDALDFMWETLTQRKKINQVVLMLKQGATAESVARTVLLAGFMQGLWTVDLVLLMAGTVMYQVAAIGERAGVKVNMKNPDKAYNSFLKQMATMTNEEPSTPELELPGKEEMSIFKGLR